MPPSRRDALRGAAIITGAACAVASIVSPTRARAAFAAAEAPPAIVNAGVKAGAERQHHESFEVEVLFTLTCPGGRTPVAVTVSFTDATGETTEQVARPCNGEWAPNNTVPANPLEEWSVTAFPGFAPIMSGEAGFPPYVLFTPPPDASGPHPFLYTVADASGIVAQAPITGTTTPEHRVNEGSAGFQEDCAARGNVKREADGGGYCVIPAATTYFAGWPVASPPASVVLLCPAGPGPRALPRVKPSRCNTLRPGQARAEGDHLIDLRWRSWGGSEAIATGVELGYHHPHVAASVRAYRLRQCSPTEARYTRLRVKDRFTTRTDDLPGCGKS